LNLEPLSAFLSARSATSAFAEASADRRSLGGGWSRLARAAGAEPVEPFEQKE
jgi:hypothetical protein